MEFSLASIGTNDMITMATMHVSIRDQEGENKNSHTSIDSSNL